MSFTTGNAQRRGRQSGTIGVTRQHVLGSQVPTPSSELLNQPHGPTHRSKKKRKTATIGSDEAIGLVITGRHDFDTFEGTDPDSTVPPISGSTLQNPDFPISYNGRGTLKFVSPIRITTVDGPLMCNGDIYSKDGLLQPLGADLVQNWTTDLRIGATGSAGNNLTLNASNTFATFANSGNNITLHVYLEWTSKGVVANGDNIYIKGLPYEFQAQTQTGTIHAVNIFPTQLGSYIFIKTSQSPNVNEFQLFSCDSGTGVQVPITGAQLGATGTLSFNMNYHGVVI